MLYLLLRMENTPLVPSVPLPSCALSSIWGVYADVCFIIWDPPFYALQTETFLSSIISTGSHYIFLTDFFRLVGLYQCTSEWKLHCERHVSSLVGLIHISYTHTHTHTHTSVHSVAFLLYVWIVNSLSELKYIDYLFCAHTLVKVREMQI